MLTKYKKSVLKKIYSGKFVLMITSDKERFLKILKHQKEFNKKIALFKKDVIHNFHNDIYFISRITNLSIAEILRKNGVIA